MKSPIYNLLTALLFLLNATQINAQIFDRVHSYGINSGFQESGAALVSDQDANLYTTGSFSGTIDFDPGVGVSNLTSISAIDVFIQKVDSSGNFLWAKSIGGSSGDEGSTINVDLAGNVYITGEFSNTVDFDPGPSVFNVTATSGPGGKDIFILKLDANGNFLWVKTLEGTTWNHSEDLDLDANGNIYITGYFSATVDFDPGPSVFNLTSAGLFDMFVLKLNINGDFQWAKSFGSTQSDNAYASAVSPSGEYYLAGSFQNTIDFDPGLGTFNLTSAGNTDIIILKLSTNGTFQWAKSIGDSGYDQAQTIELNTAGGISISGSFSYSVDFNPNGTPEIRTSLTTFSGFVLSLDTNGNFIWVSAFGSIPSSMSIDLAGNIYTTGSFLGTFDFDPSPSSSFFLSSSASSSSQAMYIHKLSPTGIFGGAVAIKNDTFLTVNAIHVDNDENIHLTGNFMDTLDFDPSPSVYNQNSNGGRDIFIASYSPDNCFGFNTTLSYSTASDTAHFTHTTTLGTAPFTYAWDFGDNTTSNLANPLHVYADTSLAYPISLEITDANNCVVQLYDTLTFPWYTPPCLLNEVTLVLDFDTYAEETYWEIRDSSGNVVESHSFYTTADNSTSLLHTFCLPTGCYRFYIYDSYGDGMCCLYGTGGYTLLDSSGMILGAGGEFEFHDVRSFCIGGAISPCTGNSLTFTHIDNANVVSFFPNTLAGIISHSWNFGDNTGTVIDTTPIHTFTNVLPYADFNVCLTTIDTVGCLEQFCDSLHFTPPVCNDYNVTLMLSFDNFANEVSWEILDSSGNILMNESYTSADNGTTIYRVFCLPTGCYDFEIYDSFGDGICCGWGLGFYSLTDTSGNVLASGGAFGQDERTNFCLGGATNACGTLSATYGYNLGAAGQVNFTPQAIGTTGSVSYFWDFGGGNTSTQTNPSFTYNFNGAYNPCLTVTDSLGCIFTTCSTVLITNTTPLAGGPCDSLIVDYNIIQDTLNPFVLWMQPIVNNAALGGAYMFFWDFGDGTGSSFGSPSHFYTSFGSYEITVMAIDSVYNCGVYFSDSITLDSIGNFSRTPIDYKHTKVGFEIKALPPVINYLTPISYLKNESIGITLSPNPAQKWINLMIDSKELVELDITVLNVSGKKIETKKLLSNKGKQWHTFSIESLPSGLYFINISNHEIQTTLKFIKE